MTHTIKHLLIDADSLIYKAACPCQVMSYVVVIDKTDVMTFQYKKDMIEFVEEMPEEWGDFTWFHKITHLEPLENAIHALDLKINAILDETEAELYTLYLSKGKNFRHDLAVTAPYKGQRPPKPHHHAALFDYMVEEYNAIVIEGLEADDVVAMSQNENTCIASIDKDLETVAGWHFNYDTYKLFYVTEIDALVRFYRQVLVGDTSDNIKGVSGIGEVKAKTFIDHMMSEEEMLANCKLLYKDDVRLLESCRLLHMTREINDDGSPVLWEFPVAA